MNRAPRRGLVRKPAPVPVLVTSASIPTFADLTGTGKRCGVCCRIYPVLVDDALCIRCDAIVFPGVPA